MVLRQSQHARLARSAMWQPVRARRVRPTAPAPRDPRRARAWLATKGLDSAPHSTALVRGAWAPMQPTLGAENMLTVTLSSGGNQRWTLYRVSADDVQPCRCYFVRGVPDGKHERLGSPDVRLSSRLWASGELGPARLQW